MPLLAVTYQRVYVRSAVAYLAWSSGCWSTPLSSGTTASSVATSAQILSMIIDNWQLLPTINLLASKFRSLNSVFSSSLGLKQPSLSASYLQERVNEGRGQRFGGVAKSFARALRARSI